jgi:hypothetical protein
LLFDPWQGAINRGEGLALGWLFTPVFAHGVFENKG